MNWHTIITYALIVFVAWAVISHKGDGGHGDHKKGGKDHKGH
jgi:hypothetical protein